MAVEEFEKATEQDLRLRANRLFEEASKQRAASFPLTLFVKNQKLQEFVARYLFANGPHNQGGKDQIVYAIGHAIGVGPQIIVDRYQCLR